MDAKEYVKERVRMFDSLRYDYSGLRNCYGVSCSRCHLDRDCCIDNTEESVDIVEKWSKEHPVKTMLTDFLEKYPNAPMDTDDGTPRCCPSDLGIREDPVSCREVGCAACWNRPLEEVE